MNKARYDFEQNVGVPRPELFIVGGTGVSPMSKMMMYRSLAESDTQALLPAEERVFHIPGNGLAPIEESAEELCEQFEKVIKEDLGGVPPVTVFHSQGALLMPYFARKRLISAGEGFGGPFRGVPIDTMAPAMLTRAIKSKLPPAIRDMGRGSDFLESLREIITNEWPSDIPFDNIAATRDWIVPKANQLGYTMPEHVPYQEYMDTPKGIGGFVTRWMFELPAGVTPIATDRPSEHITMLRSPGLRKHLRNRQNEIRSRYAAQEVA